MRQYREVGLATRGLGEPATPRQYGGEGDLALEASFGDD